MREQIRRFGRFTLDMEDLPAPLNLQPLPFETPLCHFLHVSRTYPVSALGPYSRSGDSGVDAEKAGRGDFVQYSCLAGGRPAKFCACHGLCSEGYEWACWGGNYPFLTQTHLPNEFHRLARLAMMTPSFCCEAIFCVSRVAPMHRLIREICASTRARKP